MKTDSIIDIFGETHQLPIEPQKDEASLIINAVNNDILELSHTLFTLPENQFIKQIIIAVHRITAPVMESLVQVLDETHLPWIVEDLKDDELPEEGYVFNYLSRLVENKWLVSLSNNDVISEKTLTFVENSLPPKRYDLLAFYSGEWPDHKGIIQTKVFNALGGNNETPYMQKFKECKNWEGHSCLID